MSKAGFPVNLKCPRCGEKANYVFVTENAREQFRELWRKRHADCKEKP